MSLREKIARLLRDDNAPHAPALDEHASEWLADRILEIPEIKGMAQEIERLREALAEIDQLEPRPFDGVPPDWSEQIAACSDCESYKGHPIQQGICDTHRRPLYKERAHDEREQRALGYRARRIARAALRQEQCPRCGGCGTKDYAGFAMEPCDCSTQEQNR